jgi:hypothetical protein
MADDIQNLASNQNSTQNSTKIKRISARSASQRGLPGFYGPRPPANSVNNVKPVKAASPASQKIDQNSSNLMEKGIATATASEVTGNETLKLTSFTDAAVGSMLFGQNSIQNSFTNYTFLKRTIICLFISIILLNLVLFLKKRRLAKILQEPPNDLVQWRGGEILQLENQISMLTGKKAIKSLIKISKITQKRIRSDLTKPKSEELFLVMVAILFAFSILLSGNIGNPVLNNNTLINNTSTIIRRSGVLPSRITTKASSAIVMNDINNKKIAKRAWSEVDVAFKNYEKNLNTLENILIDKSISVNKKQKIKKSRKWNNRIVKIADLPALKNINEGDDQSDYELYSLPSEKMRQKIKINNFNR